MRSNKTFSRFLFAGITLLLLGAVMFRLLLPYAATNLIHDDQPYPASDAIVLLMGDVTAARANTALELYKANAARQILFCEEAPSDYELEQVRPSAAQVTKAYLEKKSVPSSALTVVDGCAVTSTKEEALCIRSYLAKTGKLQPGSKLLIVTSWYHTSRALWLFKSNFQGSGVSLAMAQAPIPGVNPLTWWRQEFSVLAVFNEYLKWIYWLAKTPLS